MVYTLKLFVPTSGSCSLHLNINLLFEKLSTSKLQLSFDWKPRLFQTLKSQQLSEQQLLKVSKGNETQQTDLDNARLPLTPYTRSLIIKNTHTLYRLRSQQFNVFSKPCEQNGRARAHWKHGRWRSSGKKASRWKSTGIKEAYKLPVQRAILLEKWPPTASTETRQRRHISVRGGQWLFCQRLGWRRLRRSQ